MFGIRNFGVLAIFLLAGGLAGQWLGEAGELPMGATAVLIGLGLSIVSFAVLSVVFRTTFDKT